MPIVKRAFTTKEAADAFVEGVIYVNDSSVRVIAVVPHAGQWEVALEDYDADDDDDDYDDLGEED